METPKKSKRFGGHPPALGTLSLAALGNGFAGYGVSSILILYLYEPLTKGGLGMDKIVSTQILSVYSSLGFIAGIIGSYIADRVIGKRTAYKFGMIVKGLAILLLAVPNGGVALVLASIIFQLFAAGIMGQSLNALTGELYEKEDPLRDSAFSVLYILNNIGAAAPIITGTIALYAGYNIGFAVSGIILLVCILPYVFLNKRLFGEVGLKPSDPLTPVARKKVLGTGAAVLIIIAIVLAICFKTGVLTATSLSNIIGTVSIFLPFIYIFYMIKSPKTTAAEGNRLKVFITFLVANSICMMVWNQSTGILALYAADRVNLTILGIKLTPASFQTVPAVLGIIFGVIVSILWTKLGQHQPNSTLKFGIGTIFWGAGPLFMMIPLTLFGASIKVSPLWLIFFYVLIIIGEALTSPIGYSVASSVAPLAFATQMITVYSLSQSVGAGVSTLAVNFYKEGHEASYFLFIGGVTVVFGLLMIVFNKKVNKTINA
jgi:POT family proton-dependent oligopeptide transporter